MKDTLTRYTLTYAVLQPQLGGTYDRRDVATFGTEFGEPLEEHGLFYSEADALDIFRRFLVDPGGADYQTAEEVTAAEGWSGWGHVFRVTTMEGEPVLYAARVEVYHA